MTAVRKLLFLSYAWLIRSLEITVMIIMAVLVIDVLLQVFTRKILGTPWGWTDELAKMLLIWLSLLGAAVGFQRKGHLGVDYFVNKLPQKSKIFAEITVYLLIAIFSASILLFGGFQLALSTLKTGQPSPAMQIEWGHVYLALPISGCFILIFSIETIFKNIALLMRKTPEDT